MSGSEPSPTTRTTTSLRSQKVELVIANRDRRRKLGDHVSDRQLVDAHPELMPELQEALRAANVIRRAVAEAQRLGQSRQNDAHWTPIATLNDADLIAAIEDEEIESAEPEVSSPEPGEVVKNLEQHPADLEPSVAISGYTLHEQIGVGGQAVVYRATQISTGKTVAIKVLPGGPFINSRTRERFERETTILATLDHPHIVAITDRGRTADGSFYFVMPFIGGGDLDDHIRGLRDSWPNSSQAIVSLFVQIAVAIGEAHRCGVIHRDLKPSNIRVNDRGDPCVLDFGLARPGTEIAEEWADRTVTLTGHIIGSLPWMSPEQVGVPNIPATGSRSQTPDARSDVYAIGVVLYEALTGQFPYAVSGPTVQVLHNILSVHAKPPSHLQSRPVTPWDKALDDVVLRCLSKSAHERYATGNELAADLRRLAAGATAVDAPSSRRNRGVSPLSAHRWNIAGLTFAAIAILLAVWFAKRPSTVEVVQLPAFTNTVGMRLIRIPAGPVLTGSPLEEKDRDKKEHHRQFLIQQPFYLATTEVTRGQYRAVMGATSLPDGGQDDFPVTSISRADAIDFCRQLNHLEPGRNYRLPNEVEWEYACRAGLNSNYSGTKVLDTMGWFAGNSGGKLHPVAEKSPNQWGLYDLHGNAQEWCGEPFDNGYEHPWACPVRGGSFDREAGACRAAARSWALPDIGDPATGFRIVAQNFVGN